MAAYGWGPGLPPLRGAGTQGALLCRDLFVGHYARTKVAEIEGDTILLGATLGWPILGNPRHRQPRQGTPDNQELSLLDTRGGAGSRLGILTRKEAQGKEAVEKGRTIGNPTLGGRNKAPLILSHLVSIIHGLKPRQPLESYR